MRNIHVLPTNKPSRLYLGDNGNLVFGITKTSIQSRNENFTNQNIYITNDEEIKEGDYGVLWKKVLSYHQMHKRYGMPQGDKIILTTDADLIKDGVQAIPDDFLEWFVSKANDSGKLIDIVEIGNQSIKSFDTGHFEDFYKIIIPKEELCTCKTNEDFRLCKKIKDVFGCGLNEEPK